MTQVFDLILRGGTVVTPGGQIQTDIGIIGERIARIGDLSQAASGEIYGAAGLHILPGVIDSQVHFREPGLEHKADLETEARSGALGGVTAVFEMPNTNPSTITPDLLQDKLDRAKGRMDVDHAFYAGATHTNTDLLPEMELLLEILVLQSLIDGTPLVTSPFRELPREPSLAPPAFPPTAPSSPPFPLPGSPLRRRQSGRVAPTGRYGA